MNLLERKEITSVRLLIHPGCVLESGVNSEKLRAYVGVYRQLLQAAVSMRDDELMICLPCDYSEPFEKKRSELLGKCPDNLPFKQILELSEDDLDPDDYIGDLRQEEAMDPVFLFHALAEILGDRFVLALLTHTEYSEGASHAIYAKAEEKWRRHGFTLSSDAKVLAYGEYMTCCVRGFAKDFTLKYGLGRPVVVSAMTDLPIAAVMEGGEHASLVQWLSYLRDSTSQGDNELLALIKSELKDVEYHPDWINAVIRDFA